MKINLKNYINEYIHQNYSNILNELEVSTYRKAKYHAEEQGRTTLARNIEKFLDNDKPRIDRIDRRRKSKNFDLVDFTTEINFLDEDVLTEYERWIERKLFNKFNPHWHFPKNYAGKNVSLYTDWMKKFFASELEMESKIALCPIPEILYSVADEETLEESFESQISKTDSNSILQNSENNLVCVSKYLAFASKGREFGNYNEDSVYIVYVDKSRPKIVKKVTELCCLSNDDYKKIIKTFLSISEISSTIHDAIKTVSKEYLENGLANFYDDTEIYDAVEELKKKYNF